MVVLISVPLMTIERRRQWHSSTLTWKIPRMEEPGRLQSMGSLRVRHDWVTSLSFFTFMHWRRKWQPTPVFLPGESQGQGSLVGCPLWGRTELDTTEVTSVAMTIERERLKTGGEEDGKGWDGWMASLTQWTWVWGETWGYFMTSCSLNNSVSTYSGEFNT